MVPSNEKSAQLELRPEQVCGCGCACPCCMPAAAAVAQEEVAKRVPRVLPSS